MDEKFKALNNSLRNHKMMFCDIEMGQNSDVGLLNP